MKKLTPYLKAVVGFIAPGVVTLVGAVQDASPGGSAVTGQEWVLVGAACVLTSAGVYVVPNVKKGRRRSPHPATNAH